MSKDTEFKVADWIELFKNDPVAFEQKRKEWIEKTISKANPDNQRRLRGLQFEIDATIKKSKSPYQSCVNMSKLMFNKLSVLQEALKGKMPEKPNKEGTVLNFVQRAKENTEAAEAE